MPAHRHKRGKIKMLKNNKLVVTMGSIDKKQSRLDELQDKLAETVTDKKNIGSILADIFLDKYNIRRSGNSIYIYCKGKYKKLTQEVTAKKLNKLICDDEEIRGSIKSTDYKEC